MVSSTCAGLCDVTEKPREALAACLPFRQAERVRVWRSIVSLRRIEAERGWEKLDDGGK